MSPTELKELIEKVKSGEANDEETLKLLEELNKQMEEIIDIIKNTKE